MQIVHETGVQIWMIDTSGALLFFLETICGTMDQILQALETQS